MNVVSGLWWICVCVCVCVCVCSCVCVCFCLSVSLSLSLSPLSLCLSLSPPLSLCLRACVCVCFCLSLALSVILETFCQCHRCTLENTSPQKKNFGRTLRILQQETQSFTHLLSCSLFPPPAAPPALLCRLLFLQ